MSRRRYTISRSWGKKSTSGSAMKRIITLISICTILGGCVAHQTTTPLPEDSNRAIESGMIVQMRGTIPVKGNETVGAMLVRQGDEWLDLLGHRASLDGL